MRRRSDTDFKLEFCFSVNRTTDGISCDYFFVNFYSCFKRAREREFFIVLCISEIILVENIFYL